MFRAFAKFIVKWRWLIIILWIIAVPVIVKTLPSLANVTTQSNSAFLPKSSQAQHAEKLIAPFQGSNTNATLTLVVDSSSGALNPADEAAIASLEAKLKALPSISTVREQAISSDAQAEQILIGTTITGFSQNSTQVVSNIRDQFNKIAKPADLSFHLTGALAENVDDSNNNNKARNNTQTYILIFIIVLLFVVYRSILAPFITLIPAGLSLVIASPVIAESTKIGVQVSPITQLLLIVLLLGAGTDYGIFLVFRVREEMKKGREVKEAVVEALSHVGKVITFSALTVCAALLSLLLASFGFYKGLGPALAIGVGILLLSGLTLLPALIAVFGRAAYWPSKNKPVKQISIGAWGRIADRVITKPGATLVIGSIFLGALMLGLIGYKTGGFTNAAPPKNSDSAAGSAVIAAHFPAANNNPEILLLKFSKPVWNNTSLIDQTQQALSSSSLFKSISGPVSTENGLSSAKISSLYALLGPPQKLSQSSSPHLPSGVSLKDYLAYKSLSQFIDESGTTVEYYAVFKAGPWGSTAAANGIPAVRNEVSRVATSVGAVDSGVLSQDAFVYEISHTATSDLQKVVPVVLVVIGILLAILLRSLVAPLYLIITVGASYLATLGFANIVFVHLSPNSDGLSFFLPFLLFIFCMALGEDYNILVMSRIREEAHGKVSLKEAITKAIGYTGTTVTSAGIILAGTFAVLGFAGGSAEVEQIGYSIAFGILLDTFFVRTLLVPAIAVLLGKYNWWPSKLSKVKW